MNKVQSAKLNSLLTVQTHLTSSPDQVGSLPALEAGAEALTEIILGINTNVKIQQSPSGAAQAKADALRGLGDLAFEVGGAVVSFAEQSANATLMARVKYSRSAVTAGSANDVIARGQDIIDAATENLASLGEHGVTQAKLNALKQKFKVYDTLRVLPRQTKAAAAAATKALERLFPEADRLLDHCIDRLVWQFRASAPDFYDKYLVARVIVDAPTPGKDGEPAATTTSTPAAPPVVKAA